MVLVSNDTVDWEEALGRIGKSFLVANRSGQYRVMAEAPGILHEDVEIAAQVPACRLESLGDSSFVAEHRLKYPCMSGAMANGIGSIEVVEAMGRKGFLGVFGSAGLHPDVVETAIHRLQSDLGDSTPFAMNLIHSPGEPELEYDRRFVSRSESSAGGGLGVPEPDPAAGPVPGRRDSPG